MKPLVDFLILLALPLVIGFTSTNKTAATGSQYCNQRFSFCMEYPADIFSKIFEADNGDGVHIFSENEDMYVEAFGAYNVMEWTPEDIYFFLDGNLKGDYVIVKELSHNIQNDYYEAVYRVDDELRYYKSLMLDNSYATLVISVPKSMEELLNSLKNEVQLTVHI